MPGPRGLLPTSRHQSAPANAVVGSSLSSRPRSSGKAQSSSSMATPPRAFCDLGDRDLQELQDQRLVAAEHLAGGDPGQQAVADLPRGPGDRDADRLPERGRH